MWMRHDEYVAIGIRKWNCFDIAAADLFLDYTFRPIIRIILVVTKQKLSLKMVCRIIIEAFSFANILILRIDLLFCLAASKCSDDRLKPFNGTCYLFVSYPEVDWFTAQQVCAGIHGELASITTAEEQRCVEINFVHLISFDLINENNNLEFTII